MRAFLKHFFLPHHTNNQRAKLLHVDSIFLIALLFLIGSVIVPSFKKQYPQVLGISINISIQDLLTITNQERAQAGLPPLTYNAQLAQAAQAKAIDMFHDNYWAHISPTTQRTPWYFIQNAGYKYIYAGENLARGYNSAESVTSAWMASPAHRENVLSPNYQEIGFAIQEGTLTGESDTVLVVEMFGGKGPAPLQQMAQTTAPTSIPTQQVAQAVQIPAKALAQEQQAEQTMPTPIINAPLINRYSFAKNITKSLLMLFIGLFVLDFLFIEEKKISRIVGHNLDHILFLTAILIFIIIISTGAIL